MERVAGRHRPFYRPVERLAILELRAARGWSRRQTARRFHVKTATMARAGLALGVSTVARMLKKRERPEPDDTAIDEDAAAAKRVGKPVQATKPNDAWQIDLTLVPTAAGFWTAWFPFSILQRWPFCWYLACVVDTFSRRVMGFEVYEKEPNSIAVQSLVASIAAEV